MIIAPSSDDCFVRTTRDCYQKVLWRAGMSIVTCLIREDQMRLNGHVVPLREKRNSCACLMLIKPLNRPLNRINRLLNPDIETQ